MPVIASGARRAVLLSLLAVCAARPSRPWPPTPTRTSRYG